jgi:hypothetical protein
MVFKRCGVGAETYGANDHHDKVEEATEGVADTITCVAIKIWCKKQFEIDVGWRFGVGAINLAP